MLARVARGSAVTVAGFGAQQAIRLGANLLLARLLFPEAFGLMALVNVLMVGLAMFSDIGITPSIQSSKRGDEPTFLNTAWTIQVIRGAVLLVAASALAWPMAWFYEEPMLLQLIPVAALSLLLASFEPTRVDTASRHMLLGRLTLIQIVAQLIGVAAMLWLAWTTSSVWALVLGGLVGTLATLVLAWTVLPGHSNRLQWDVSAAGELISYGKWIFLSTVSGFLVMQSDKLILAHFLSFAELGLYNIGYFLAGIPLMLGQALVGRLMIPIYRESPPDESRENFLRVRRLRLMLTGGLLAISAPLALAGVWIVDLLYDERYLRSGAVLVAMSLALIPQLITLTYDQVALARGDSRGFFLVTALRAVVLVGLLLALVPTTGKLGAAIAIAMTPLLSYPVLVRLARRHGAWDKLHDLVTILTALLLGVAAITVNAGPLRALAGL